MTSKSLKRRKTITHKKVRNHKKTRGGGGEVRHVPRATPQENISVAEVRVAVFVISGIVLSLLKITKVI